MSFFEERFDERLVVTQSGKRYTNRNWQFPLHRYDVSHAVKTADDFEVVRAMFYNVAGAFDGFRFKDWSDYVLTRDNSEISDSIGSPSEWQIYRLYVVGARTFRRPIFKPCATPTLKVWRTRSGSLARNRNREHYDGQGVDLRAPDGRHVCGRGAVRCPGGVCGRCHAGRDR
jgi:hypothetical protein